MGIQLNGTSGTDVISAVDGSLTVEGLTISGDFNIADKIIHSGDTNTAIRFPAADTVTVETGGSERLRCDSDGVKVHNGRFYSAGTFAYIESSSTSNSTLTLRKTASGADSIDYLQFRNNANGLLLKVGGDGIIYTSDVLASHEGDTDTKIRFPAADTISFETAATERLRITSTGKVCINNDTALSDLHVCTAGSSEQDGTLRIGGTNAELGLVLDYDQSGSTVSRITANPTYTSTSSLLKICVDGDANTNQLVLKGNGKIGINQANPTTALLEIFNSGSAVQGLDVYTNDVGTTAIAKFRGYNNTHGAQDRLIITAKGTLQVNADIANDTDNVAHFQSVHNNKHGSLRVNGHAGTNAVKGIVELIGYAAGGGHGRHAFITASDTVNPNDGSSSAYATRMDFKMRETSAWQHTSMTDKLTLHPGYAGTVDVKGIPAHLRLYSQRNTSDWDSTDPIGKLDFYVGDDTSNNLPYNAGFIHCLNETDNANEPSGALVFGTTSANLSGGAIERVRIASGGQMRVNPPATNGGSTVLAQQALIGTKHIYTAYHNFSSTNSNMNITSIKTNSCGELWIIGGWANGNGLRMKKYTWVASGDTAITEQSNTFASRYGVGITINTPTMSISGDYVHFNFTFSDNQGSKLEKLKIHFEYFYQFKVDS